MNAARRRIPTPESDLAPALDEPSGISMPKSAPGLAETGPHGFLDARSRYTAVYSKWLRAAASLADESNNYHLFTDSDAAEEHAAAKFLAMRPPLKWMIWHKFEVLDRILEQEDRGGVRDREREMHALAAIKADLLFFGFGSP